MPVVQSKEANEAAAENVYRSSRRVGICAPATFASLHLAPKPGAFSRSSSWLELVACRYRLWPKLRRREWWFRVEVRNSVEAHGSLTLSAAEAVRSCNYGQGCASCRVEIMVRPCYSLCVAPESSVYFELRTESGSICGCNEWDDLFIIRSIFVPPVVRKRYSRTAAIPRKMMFNTVV